MKNQLNIDELALLWLHSFSFSEKKRDAILSLLLKPRDIFSFVNSSNDVLKAIVGEDVFLKMINTIDQGKELENQIDKLGIKIITKLSNDYPSKLKNIPNAPLVLFALGNIDLLKMQSIAVVGTRKPTDYGKEVSKIFCTKFAQAGLVIISGLAYGIDCIAHKTAIENNSKTIAVMAGGLDEIYPSAHTGLAKNIILSGGLLISEYFPKIRPTQYSFPERNRIISGLSDGVLVVEAGENSGSLHTISHALDQGKEIYIIPANITSEASYGSNRILTEIPHAMVTSPNQILDKMGIKFKNNNLKLSLSENETKIYNLIKKGGLNFDELAQKSEINVSMLNSMLTLMEMNGIIKRLPGNIIKVVSDMEIV